eukprot:TRINITY_DN11997_c0_g1_i1.p1 TRINITY_DN11997_c0_g1~~TRINITY_DN11997_c0_g1_i1.p1  ORF type:complete len:117 (+),score=23.06 TRINITY_DN11997_c0_g1_i1:32-382(+)
MSNEGNMLEQASKRYREIQTALQNLVENKKRLVSQLHENELVKKEFQLLDGDSTVYKLIGPVLVRQELPEARGNVDKRVEFINDEINRLDNKYTDLEKDLRKARDKLIELQQQNGN